MTRTWWGPFRIPSVLVLSIKLRVSQRRYIFLIKEGKEKKKTQDVLLQCSPGIGGVQMLAVVGGGTARCQALPP